METELFNIFDDHKQQIGVATRAEVHRIGYWHETFHCWFVAREDGEDFLYMQIRSDHKKDYPSLFDITAAGHLLAHETVQDGVREVREEIGINVSIDELVSLGDLDYCVTRDELIDREIAHVYLYESDLTFDDFTLQIEEVSGMLKVRFKEFEALWRNLQDEIFVEGFSVDQLGSRVFFVENAGKERFVPHEQSYYEAVLDLIKAYLLASRSKLS